MTTLILRVTSLNGKAPARPIEAEFDDAGGTIGRADDNRLVLPDSRRLISRVHARIVRKADGFELVDQGGNAIDVNGTSLGRGETVRLRAGDELRIGGYTIGVAASSSAPVPDRAPGASKAAFEDPLAAFGSPSSADPLGLGFRSSSAPPEPVAARAGRTAPAGAIPDDFDPFADPFAVRPAPLRSPETLSDDLGLGPGTSQSVDALFDLSPPSATDPFAGGPLSESAGPRGAAPPSLDPLEPWQGRRQVQTDPPAADRVPEIHGSFKPPIGRSRPAPPPSAPPSPSPAPPPQGSAFLSWEEDAGGAPAPAPEIRPGDLLEILGGAKTESEEPPAVATARPAATHAAAAVSQADSTHTEPNAVPPDRDRLTEAFLTGLGASRLPLQQMTPEMMERIGQLLREATQGTLDLLRARAMTKREVRAEATMIVGEDNNPLKFSPDVAVALAHLIAPQGSGFLPPVEAMRDAYDDLRTHQFGFMAGVRAALAGVLKRFDPAVLEERLLHKSLLDSVLPMNRRAKLWDLYEQLYRDIADEAEEDFHTLFGKAFLRAYEEQVARLGERDIRPR